MKPDRAYRKQDQREPRPERHRQSEHENEVPEIHRVTRVSIESILHEVFWRHGDAGTPAALVHAMMSGEAILQVAPGEEGQAPRHDDEIAAADRELECDHARRIDQESAYRGAL